jgi:hypothetical protein
MSSTPAHSSRGPLFWLATAAGWALMAFGVRGIFIHHIDTRPRDLARFFVGGLVGHDLLFAPLVALAALGARRLLPARLRGPIEAAVFVVGIVFLFAYPGIRRYAHVLHNPTSLPHDYLTNAALVGGIAGVVALAVGVLASRSPPR